MLKRKILSCAIIVSMLTAGINVKADNVCSHEYFTDNIQKLSASLGTVDYEIPSSPDPTAEITKQNAVKELYELLIRADSQYIITPEQADEILNSCYDNAYIKEENKVAYASMIRHGIISTRSLTYPDKKLTKESADILYSRIQNLFTKKYPVSVGDKTISIGSSVDEVYAKFGTPDRIDKSEYGFDWYVYNSYYSDFIMIGIKDDIVCSYFTNAKNFSYDGISSGDTKEYFADENGPQIFRDHNGAVDSVWYNPCSVTSKYDEQLQYTQLLDMINANRAKNGLLTLFPDKLNIPVSIQENKNTLKAESTADNALEAYLGLFLSDNGTDLLSYPFSISSTFVSKVEYTEEGMKNNWSMYLINHDNLSSSLPKIKGSTEEEDTKPIKKISKPEIISPTMNQQVNGNNLQLSLKKRCADKYLVTIYNVEQDRHDVYAYISSKSATITIPSYMLTKGNVYRVNIAAVSGDEKIPGNTIEFTYGKCESPISLASPVHGLSTYDDEIEIMASSPAYRKFRVDVYNEQNNVVLTQELENSGNCVLQTLAPGKYHVCVTAVSSATGKDMGNQFSTVEIKPFTPEIREFILEPGETFDYYYGDGINWLYFYDTETIAVTEDHVVTVPVEDMLEEPGEAPEEEETEVKTEEAAKTTEASEAEEVAATPEPTAAPAPTVVPVKENDSEEKESAPTAEPEPVQTPAPTAEPAEAEKTEETTESEKSTEENAEEKEEEKEVVESITVYKTKITQRKVPATKRYRALAGLIPQYTSTNGMFMERNSTVTPTETGNAIAAMALSYQGVPYVWGGTSPSGFDCSGLVKYICNSLGVKNVARTSAQQFATSGSYVEKSDLIPGDLVFFQKNGKVHHVGIYIGNGKMVHAPHTGDVVKISSLSESYYQREYAGAKRVA